MPRIRSIKPEFWSDEHIARLDFFTRLLYIAMWNFADDEGRNRCIAKELVGFAFPLDEDVERGDVERGIQALAASGRIVLYCVDGVRCYQVAAWTKHQSVNRPTPSRFPAPPLEDSVSDSRSPHGVLTESLTEASSIGIRNQESGIRKQATGNSNARDVTPPVVAEPIAAVAVVAATVSPALSKSDPWQALAERSSRQEVEEARDAMRDLLATGHSITDPIRWAEARIVARRDQAELLPTGSARASPRGLPTAEEIEAANALQREVNAAKERELAARRERTREQTRLAMERELANAAATAAQ